ncbi:hypothetical protein PP182_04005 [Maribacter sp. PR1]|uniref:DUF4440 domain-containing protein n=1 Tax=Maribacter cobaltidurans TaxID=1178778 RepID=A0ABU7IQH9_9FLAO|nr:MULTISPECIES: hypothetical protein [Maribacter]MDC6387828.1 hypothetical protein [Maribacter sp. PR1]MEE1975217.1 hypothetical protein [Maribacter cobaltidurans]
MKPFPVFQVLTAACAFLTITSCQEKETIQENIRTPDAMLQTLIKEQVDSLYSVYSRFDYDWIDFYEDRFTAIYPESPVKLNSKDSLRAQWEGIYQDFDVQLLDRGQPNIIASEDMAISYNSFNEIFVNKQTRDTTKSTGTYIVAWRRQPNNTWKIAFETLHNN